MVEGESGRKRMGKKQRNVNQCILPFSSESRWRRWLARVATLEEELTEYPVATKSRRAANMNSPKAWPWKNWSEADFKIKEMNHSPP